jgi:hypothetical protein
MLSELLSCHAGCNVEHFLQNGFRTVFCEVMGTGSWDRRVLIVYRGMMISLLGEPAAIQTNFGCSEAHRQSPLSLYIIFSIQSVQPRTLR